jgi:hypothetical protein
MVIHQQYFCEFSMDLLLIREGKLQLLNNDSRLLSHNEIDDIITHTCTS